MTKIKPTLLVLAAGMGSRYGGLKQVDKLGPSGETITDYSIYDAIRAGFGKIVFVIRKSIEADFKEVFSKFDKKINIEYVFQELDNIPQGIAVPPDRQKPWGTGHAVIVAEEKINTPFAVINADDFYGAKSYQAVADHLTMDQRQEKDTYCMVGFILQNTLSDFGHVARGICELDSQQRLKSITERTQIQKELDKIKYKTQDDQWHSLIGNEMVSMNFWGFPTSVFGLLKSHFNTFIKNSYTNNKAEFYLPIAINDLIQEQKANVKVLSTPEPWFGMTYKEDKADVMAKINALVKAGVYPNNLWA